MKKQLELKGDSYAARVKAVNEIYDKWAQTGLSNREIWRRYVWPVYRIAESTYNKYISLIDIYGQEDAREPELFDQQQEDGHHEGQ
jgi:hypothetical protein